LRRRFPGSVSGASLSAPYTPRRSGKAERSRRKDNEEFYASHKFYSFDALPLSLPSVCAITAASPAPSQPALP